MRIVGAAFLLLASALCLAQLGVNPADEKAEEALFASTWSGMVYGVPVSVYLLDENQLVYQAGEQKSAFNTWRLRDGRFAAQINLPDKTLLNLIAEVRGDAMRGTIDNLMGKALPLELKRDAAKNDARVAMAPNRPHPKPPEMKPAEVEGTWGTFISANEGQKGPPSKELVLRCKTGSCVLSIDKKEAEIYDKPAPVRSSHFQQARRALDYARERREIAKEAAPWLAPLLDSQSDLRACMDLTPAVVPGMMLLCTLDSNPWKKPVVIMMGTILASCGPAFCRFALQPLFRQ